jgi:hypothetical protein
MSTKTTLTETQVRVMLLAVYEVANTLVEGGNVKATFKVADTANCEMQLDGQGGVTLKITPI